MSITRKSSDALAKRLAAIAPEIKARVAPALLKSAEEVADKAKALAEASRRTGELVESIDVVKPGGTLTAGDQAVTLHELQAAVHASAPHAHLVELGSEERTHADGSGVGAMPAQPFLLPAWRLARTRVQRRVQTAIRAGVKDALKAGNGGSDDA